MDPWEKRVPGLGLGRDGARTPMQWDSGPFAGFSTVEPWLPLADDFTEVNVQVEKAGPFSMLTLTRSLLELRRSRAALARGSYRSLGAQGGLLAYLRETEGERLLVALNLGGDPLALALPDGGPKGEVLLSTFCDREGEAVNGALALRANEGVVVALG
jgi:alpha-glucosidase